MREVRDARACMEDALRRRERCREDVAAYVAKLERAQRYWDNSKSAVITSVANYVRACERAGISPAKDTETVEEVTA
jgi:hypothetical protein